MAFKCACVIFYLLVVVGSQRMGDNVQYRPNTCLQGDKHIERPYPGPENGDYQACHQWRDAACCTAEFTQILAQENVSEVDGFVWDRCGQLSSSCQEFFVQIECFYRCSPNVAHFANVNYDSALANLPVCGDYCDSWYDACKDDLTCAANWITDWNYTNGSNYCITDATCRPYSEVYRDGRGLCNTLWGASFFYSNSTSADSNSERVCLQPYFPINSVNPNTVVIERFFNSSGPENVASIAVILFAMLLAHFVY